MCDSESVKILFSVRDRCRGGRYLQGQAQLYVTTGNVETSVICHNWLSYVSVRACVCDQASHGRTGLPYNYRTPVEVILTKIIFTEGKAGLLQNSLRNCWHRLRVKNSNTRRCEERSKSWLCISLPLSCSQKYCVLFTKKIPFISKQWKML
jgi:hypothetical protein